MSRRAQVVIASALAVIGLALESAQVYSGQLNAAGVGSIGGVDLAKVFLWVGAFLLIVSAFLYIRASSE